MGKYFKGVIFVVFLLMFNLGCNKDLINPNIPNVSINITIDPNSTLFQELNAIGGWVYLDEKPGVYIPYGSRGIIVYRLDTYEFKAYERQPPENQGQCCSGADNCTKLLVGDYYPFVKDTCTDVSYLLLDGTIIEGEGQYPLIQYQAAYDGYLLHIYN